MMAHGPVKTGLQGKYKISARQTVVTVGEKIRGQVLRVHLGRMSNEVPLCSTGASVQPLGTDHGGRSYGKKDVRVCTTGPLRCTAEVGTTL